MATSSTFGFEQYTGSFEEDAVQQIEQRLESCVADGDIRVENCEVASWEDTGWNAIAEIERTWQETPEVVLEPAGGESGALWGSDADLTEYFGPVATRIYDGRINITYKVRDESEQDWSSTRERTYSPFQTDGFSPMELPVTLDGDEITIDYSALNEPNPQWLNPENR